MGKNTSTAGGTTGDVAYVKSLSDGPLVVEGIPGTVLPGQVCRVSKKLAGSLSSAIFQEATREEFEASSRAGADRNNKHANKED